jgi:hypothetical protein
MSQNTTNNGISTIYKPYFGVVTSSGVIQQGAISPTSTDALNLGATIAIPLAIALLSLMLVAIEIFRRFIPKLFDLCRKMRGKLMNGELGEVNPVKQSASSTIASTR